MLPRALDAYASRHFSGLLATSTEELAPHAYYIIIFDKHDAREAHAHF